MAEQQIDPGAALRDFKRILEGEGDEVLGSDNFFDGSSADMYHRRILTIPEEVNPFQTGQRRGVSLSVKMEHIAQTAPVLADLIYRHPEKTLDRMGEKFREVVLDIHGEDYADWIPYFHIRVYDIDDLHHIKIRDLGSFHIEKPVKVTGLITRISEIKPLLRRGVFQCPQCGNNFEVVQDRMGQYTSPSSVWKACPNPECNNRKLSSMILLEHLSDLIDWQMAYLQEPPEDLPPGTTPKGIEMIFTDDYVESVSPGVRVEVTGILHFRPAFNPTKSDASRDPIFDKFIEVVHLKSVSEEEEAEELLPGDEDMIRQLGNRDDIEELIVNSIATSMYGYREIKLGIAMLAVGGVEHRISGEGRNERGDLNILLAGDPSTGKSVAGDELIYIDGGSGWGRVKIGDFVDEVLESRRGSVASREGSEVVRLPGGAYRTMSMDPEDLKVKAARVTEVSRHEAGELVRVTTASGRAIAATPDHSFTALVDGRLKTLEGSELSERYSLPVAKGIDLDDQDPLSEVFWDEISEVERLGTGGRVYDIGTEHGHFVAGRGDLVTHNSQFLTYSKELSPKRYAYASGKKSTAAGLTAGMVKDARTGVLTLEAGAVVYASGGICCTTADSEFVREGGARITFGELFEGERYDLIYPDFRVLGLNTRTLRVEPVKVRRAFRIRPRNRVLRLTTVDGRSVNLTEDNEVLVSLEGGIGWRRAGRLRRGDLVAVPRDAPAKAGGRAAWVALSGVEEVEADWVYDFTVASEHANFVCNDWVIHNCIDEFDKVDGNDLDSLLEVMVSQQVTINKAGINATMPAKCAILAAMNPKYLRYRPDLSFAENMNLEETISSRFDLIFLLLDNPEPDFDNSFADHILHMFDDDRVESDEGEESESGWTVVASDGAVRIPKDKLMKYIRYVKDNVRPQLTDTARQKAKEYYLQMRAASYGGLGDALVADRRTLSTIRRVAEANARLRLNETVDEHDVDVAYDLYQYSLRQIAMDEMGNPDLDAIRGLTRAKQDITVKVLKVIRELEGEADATEEYSARTGVPVSKILERAEEKGVLRRQEGVDLAEKLRSVLDTLYERGDVYKPRDGSTDAEVTYKTTRLRRTVRRGR
jgi:DNA replicative helicase MCM subunit Mcm2 (Cdc46/Mcm family)